LDRALVSSYRLSIVTMSLTAAVWPQFATQVFRGGIERLTSIGIYVNKQVLRLHFGRRQQHVRNIILGQLWTPVASVHHEYGRLTLATGGLLFFFQLSSNDEIKLCCSALLVNVPGLVLLVTLCSLAGMVVYVEYRRCDPLATHRIDAKDQVLMGACIAVKQVKVRIAVYGLEIHDRATERHLPYGIARCYLPPDTGERASP